MEKVALVVAGGKGARMGAAIPKQFLRLKGVPILVHTLRAFWNFDSKIPAFLVLPKSEFDRWKEISDTYLSPEERERVNLCAGGANRTQSVFNGLKEIRKGVGQANPLVAIQDGVRPFINSKILKESFELAEKHGASVTCVPVKSSMRRQHIDGTSSAVDRSFFYHVQTPQTFHFESIYQAYTQLKDQSFTDDASLFEATGESIVISEGSYDNIKITTGEDMFVAEQILKKPGNISFHNTQIKLVLMDVDGTLTDGGVAYTEKGDVIKRFDVKDGMAIHRMITRHGMEFGFISAGATAAIIEKRAQKLGVKRWYSGTRPKIEVIREWLVELNVDLDHVAYIGDDLNDIAVMEKVGLSACPSDAVKEVKQVVNHVLEKKGGQGCVREFLEKTLGYSLVDKEK